MTRFCTRLPRAWLFAVILAGLFLCTTPHGFALETPPEHSDWTNPVTGISTHFAEPWSVQKMPSEDGTAFFMMSDEARVVAIFAYEPLEEQGMDPATYGQLFAEAKVDEMTIAPDWQRFSVAGHKAVRSSMVTPESEDVNGEVIVTIAGKTSWRLVLIGMDEDSIELFSSKAAFVEAMLSTVDAVSASERKP